MLSLSTSTPSITTHKTTTSQIRSDVVCELVGNLSLPRIIMLMLSQPRGGICQILYTSKIPKFSNLTWEKRINRDILAKNWEWRMFLIYFEQIVSFCAIIYSNTNSLQLFCETVAGIRQISQIGCFLRQFLQILPESKCHLWHIPCLSQPGPNGFGIVLLVQRIKPKLFWQKWNSRGKCLKKVFFYNRVQQPFFQPKKQLIFQRNCCSFKKEQLWTLSRWDFFFKTSHFFCEDLLLKMQNMLIAINCEFVTRQSPPITKIQLWIYNEKCAPAVFPGFIFRKEQ